MNKSTLTTIALATLGLASAQAGSSYVSYGKAPKSPAPVIEVPSLCECFAANTASVSVFAAGIIPESNSADLDDAFGGGIALNYFFTENFGLEGSYSVFATESEVHQFSGSFIARLPIKSLCLAPYALAGGSFHTDGVSQGTWHVGAGLDYRIANCVGVFADAQYNWAEDTSDYTTVRGGVRFGF
jgi:outer membrane protein W